MSFFRNLRTKARSKSTSRDTTPVNTNSRPGSVLSNATTTHTNGSASARRESLDSRTDSLLNRSDTFILDSDLEEEKDSKHNSSNNSTLEKKSKKSKVLSKFATFTKRKKTPTPEKVIAVLDPTLEHHPSDNATNTYYKWKAEGPSSAHALDYDVQTDPFHFLYEQHSSLKDMQKRGSGSNNGSIRSTQSSAHSSANEQNRPLSSHSTQHNQYREPNQPFDSSTFRKGKMPAQLKEQLSQLKEQTKSDLHEAEEDPETAADKYKTVTLNSFRKSFREKFLQNQNNPPHNPAWFVEVEAPKVETRARCESKENRPDFLIFDNDNYRPSSRSPVRHGSKERTSRVTSRSPVKRNETFRMERPTIEKTSVRQASPSERQKRAQLPDAVPSIRIEIKNSITPNLPGRLVPVGVAKPMPAQDNYQRMRSTGGSAVSKSTKVSERDKSPQRNWAKPITVTPVRYPSAGKAHNASTTPTTHNRFQTLVQIRNEANAKPALNRSQHSTRIQLGGLGGSPTLQKRLNTPGTRHSLATPMQMNALRSYELLKSAPIMTTKSVTERKLQQPKHTYFGDANISNAGSPTKSISTTTFTFDRTPVNASNISTTTTTTTTSTMRSYPTSASRLQQPQVVRIAGGNTPNYQQRSQHQPNQQQHFQQQQQQQQQTQRVLVPMQRRSRSPIKMPWR